MKVVSVNNGTNRSRREVPKGRTPVRRIWQSFFEYVFHGGPKGTACLHGATRVGLSRGSSFSFRDGWLWAQARTCPCDRPRFIL